MRTAKGPTSSSIAVLGGAAKPRVKKEMPHNGPISKVSIPVGQKGYLMTSIIPEPSNSNQYETFVALLPGRGQAKFFADVEFRFGDGRRIRITGFPVWNGGDGELRPDLPTKPGTKNPAKRFPVVEFDSETWAEISRRIRNACKVHQQAEQEN